MIFFKQKIIFIHIPRCGGTSIEQNLWNNEYGRFFSFNENNHINLLQGFVDKYRNKFQSDGLQHLTFKNIKKIYPEESNSFFKFTFVRNPFSRAASLYCEIMKYRKDLRDFLVIYNDSSFKSFLKSILKNHHTHWMPAHRFFEKDDVDTIGKFETYDIDLNSISKRKNVKFTNQNFSENTNFSASNNYLNFYNDKDNIRLVEELYNQDLDQFSYSFDNFITHEESKKDTKSMIPYINLHKKEVKFSRFLKRYFKKKIYMAINGNKFKSN